MGSKVDFFKSYTEAVWVNPPESVMKANQKYMADDFQNFDPDGNVTGDKAAYIGMNRMIMGAFPDFKAVYHDFREEGDSVVVRFNFEGTHSRDLDMSAMGLGVLPASGRKIVWPENTVAFEIRGEQIASIRPYGESNGIADFLAPLGVELPAA